MSFVIIQERLLNNMLVDCANIYQLKNASLTNVTIINKVYRGLSYKTCDMLGT